MTRSGIVIPVIAALVWQAGAHVAYADDVRHTAFPDALVGTWGQNAQFCTARDKSNIVVAPAGYRAAGQDCAVIWIVETAGAAGPNYSVRASCSDPSNPSAKRVENLIVRPQSGDRLTVGASFESQQPYQRCADAQ
jgi:hypothetical protein